MSTNGNPVGSRKVMAAQARIDQERSALKGVQAFTEDSEKASKVLGIKIENGVIPSFDLVLNASKDHPDLFRFLQNGVEISSDVIVRSLQVIRDCKRVLKRFEG